TVTGVSPRAKKLAEKNDIDPSLAVPTGPNGRIIERDVRQLTVNNERAGSAGH
ncbi:MAG: E3 binding domain-containing protein, partial [Oscillospiraceae bacterium]|nr:E3 binding domain-containing protein [Oscillospiraceae bacterium]